MFLEAQEENGTALPNPRSREKVLADEEFDYLSDYIIEI